MDAFTPTPADKFSFGLWTVGWQGVDVFGTAVRPPLDPTDAILRLADLGAYGISFHDNDVFPFGCPDSEREASIKALRRALADTGLCVPMVTTNLFSHPVFRDGGFTNNDRDVRRFAIRKVADNIDLAAELGASTFVAWGGREGAESGAAKDVAPGAGSLQGGVRCPRSVRHRSRLPDRVRSRAEAERASWRHPPADRRPCARVHRELEHPELVGLNPEVGHEEMASLNFAHGLAQALWHGKLFHVDLNGQHGPRYDQDLRFGAGNARGAFWTVDILESGGYDGPRHFDFKPPRTEDIEGVWVSAAACMRNYLILKAKAAAFRADPDVEQALRDARVDQLALSTLADGETIATLARRGVRPRRPPSAGWVSSTSTSSPWSTSTARDEAMTLVAGVDSSTSATKVEIRDLDDGRVVASGSRPHEPTRPPRSEQDPAGWWAAFEGAWSRLGRPRSRRSPSPVSSTAWSCSTELARSCARPSCGTTRSRRPTRRGCSAGSTAVRAGWAEACGSVPVASFTITKLSWLHRTEPASWERLAHVVLPHDWLTYQLTGRLSPTAVTPRGRATGRPPRAPTGSTSSASSTATATGPASCRRSSVRRNRRGSGAVPLVAPGTGDNMAAALASGCARAMSPCRSARPGRCTACSATADGDPSGAVAGFAERRRSLPAARVHAERDEGHGGGAAPARRRPRRVRRARAGVAAGARGPHPAAVPRRRAHAEPARRHWCARRAAAGRRPRRPRQGSRRGSRVRAARRARRAVGVGALRRPPDRRRRRRQITPPTARCSPT